MGVGRCQEIQQDKRCGGPGFLGGIQSAVPAAHRKPDTAGSVFPLSPGIVLGPSSPEPWLTRGEKVADRGSLSTLTGPRSRSCQPLWDTGSSWTSPAMCVWVEGCLSPSCHGRPRFYTGHSLQCPDGDPRASLTSRPGWGLGGQRAEAEGRGRGARQSQAARSTCRTGRRRERPPRCLWL